jgi:mannitol 2-dehydrogenase
MLLACEAPLAVVAAMSGENVKIVSMTITEYGYRVPLTPGDFRLIELALGGAVQLETG